MGNYLGSWMKQPPPPPPMVLVPPLFDYPPLAARTRMLESPYNLLFGKLPLRCLFHDYFQLPNHFTTKLMLKPTDDPHVDLIATVSGPLDPDTKETVVGNALFRLQSDVDDPHTFADLFVSTSDPVSSEDYGLIGLRYGSSNLSLGATLMPYSLREEFPKSAWFVSKIGRLTVGVQFDPKYEKKEDARYTNLKNWNCAIGYGLGTGSPLSPSFNFGLELAQNSQFIASFYQHVVVQRRVKNPLEDNEVVGITNYIDFGFELQTRINDEKASNNMQDSTFNVAASWQANKNIMVKAKAGPLGSSFCLAFKSWWKPSFTFGMSAIRDRTVGKTSYGFSVCVDNVREASYQRADPNFVMLTPNKEHLAEGIHWKSGSRTLLQSNVDSGNFDAVPKELRPLGTIL